MSFEPTVDQVAAALAHAEAEQPMEACGVIAGDQYFRLRNEATVHDAFAMDMRGYHALDQQYGVAVIVHSHVYLPAIASDGDRAGCEKTGKPWLIISWPTGQSSVIEPSGWRAPLVGRQWAWGSLDCFGLVRDAFQAYTGILLPDFERDWLFWERGENLVAEHFAEAGFIKLPQDSEPKHCDVFGMKINAKVVNHLGIFLAEHGGVMLHQLMGRLSIREIYGGTYRQATVLHLRHRKFLEPAP
jgi:proteasome lid subunit RPN8/RPN11